MAIGVPKDRFAAITHSINNPASPMNIDLFHRYVHDRFATPSPGELTAAWDHAQLATERRVDCVQICLMAICCDLHSICEARG
jgi:hypothetical protein